MKILITEEIAPAGIEMLKEHHEVRVATGLSQSELCEQIGDIDAVIIRSATKLDAAVFDCADNLKVVGRAGIGVDNIDLHAATRNGVIVVNAPQSNVVSAAEHTMALLLAQARNVAQADESLRQGRWDRKKLEGVELYGKTLGILGLGRVGTLVAQRALAFDMIVVACDPFLSVEAARALGVELVAKPEDVYAQADFISVHLPRTPETEGIINAQAISQMRDGVRIINTARGGLIDDKALAEALRSGKVGGVGIDVYDEEPCIDSELFVFRNGVFTPHLGASTVEAQDRAGVTIAQAVMDALEGEFVLQAVNVEIGREVAELVRSFVPVAEFLGQFFAAYAGGIGKTIEIEMAGGLSDHDTRVLTLAALKGLFARVVEEPVTFVNAPLIAEERGVEVRETVSTRTRDYLNLISISGKVGRRRYSVAGTIAGAKQAVRIVRVLDYEIELPPTDYMAIISNDDRPGVIGLVGTLLGEAGVNIRNMVVGRHSVEPLALMGLNLDQPVSPAAQEKVRKAAGVIEARFLEL